MRIKINTFPLLLSILCLTFGFPIQAAPPADNPNIFVGLAKKVVPSVVNISTYTSAPQAPFGGGGPQEDYFRWFFEEFFGQPGPGSPGGPGGNGRKNPFQGRPKKPNAEKMPLSLGTGFIIDSDGLILTNNHVIGDAEEIKIKFTEDSNEEPTTAEVVGKDPDLDVALIRVKVKKKLTPLPLGDSDALEVGEYVAAVGNPFGRGHSVTHGIVSAKHRDAPGLLAKYIQTDAPINPGNSGGPLVNLQGEVIGVNNAIDARAQGIGFSIPINMVKGVLPQLKTKGVVERGYIGVVVGELSDEIAEQVGAPKTLKAPFVTHVDEGETAFRAGIRAYDVIVEVNGKPVRSANDLVMEITAVPVGGSAQIKVLRNGKEKTYEVKVGKRPENPKVSQWKRGRNPPGAPNRGGQEAGIEMGLALQDSTQPKGVLVTDVQEGSPAESAGLVPGDVILEVNQTPIGNVKAFQSIVNKKKSYLIRVMRRGPSGQVIYQVLILDLKD